MSAFTHKIAVEVQKNTNETHAKNVLFDRRKTMKKSNIFMRSLAVILTIALLLPSMVVVGSASEVYSYDSDAGESEHFDGDGDLLFDIDEFPFYNDDDDLLYGNDDSSYNNDDDFSYSDDDSSYNKNDDFSCNGDDDSSYNNDDDFSCNEDDLLDSEEDDEPAGDEGFGDGNYIEITPFNLSLDFPFMIYIYIWVDGEFEVRHIVPGAAPALAPNYATIIQPLLMSGLVVDNWSANYSIRSLLNNSVISSPGFLMPYAGFIVYPLPVSNPSNYVWMSPPVFIINLRSIPPTLRGEIKCEERLNHPIPGVTVTLYNVTDPNNIVRVDSRITGADGSYNFGQVPIGDLLIRFDVPNGYNARADYLLSTQSNVVYVENFELVPIPPTLTGTITCGETGNPIPGVTVTLYDENGNAIATATTDANGIYSFGPGEVPFGNLEIRFPNIPGGYNTPANRPIATAPGGVYVENFGLVPIPPTLTGTITSGVTGNPVPGVTVTLYDENGDAIATTTTDENGIYSFGPGEVPFGDLEIRFSNIPDGYNTPANRPITTGPGGAYVKNLGLAPIPPILTGTIIYEETGNPARGVTVTLYDDNNVAVAARRTRADGSYSFGAVPIGNLEIRLSDIPAEYTVPANRPLTTAPGGNYVEDFELAPILPVLSGTVACEMTGNPVWGVTVTLYSESSAIIAATTMGINGLSNNSVVIATTRTDASGSFDFGEVPIGDFEIGLSTIPRRFAAPSSNIPITTMIGGVHVEEVLLTPIFTINIDIGNNNNNSAGGGGSTGGGRDNDRDSGNRPNLPRLFGGAPATGLAVLLADADYNVYYRIAPHDNINLNPSTGGFAQRTFTNGTSENESGFRTFIAILVFLATATLVFLIRREVHTGADTNL